MRLNGEETVLSFRATPGWGGGGEQRPPAPKLHTAPAKCGAEREDKTPGFFLPPSRGEARSPGRACVLGEHLVSAELFHLS